jgi:hypothetical protein
MKHLAIVVLIVLAAAGAFSQTQGFCDTVTTAWTKIVPIHATPKPFTYQILVDSVISGSGKMIVGCSYKVDGVLKVDTTESTNGASKTTRVPYSATYGGGLLWDKTAWFDTLYVKMRDGSAILQTTGQ